MTLVEAVLAIAAGAALVPVSVLLAQIIAAGKVTQRPTPAGSRPAVAILIPAHNEASIVRACLASIGTQVSAGDRILVVADNCTDDTVPIAKAAGAEVVERRDVLRRGKGYALDYGVRHLAGSPPAVVIVMDADCTAAPGAVDRLARECVQTGRPAQALYEMQSSSDHGVRGHIGAFAWIVRNKVRPLGYHRMGLPCQLMGTGMAFPWNVISDAPLASATIVEDLELGIELARRGVPPIFCPDALVASRFPETTDGLAAQRRRWEHGHLGLITGKALRLLGHALRKGNGPLLAMALDLAVPPLALLALLLSALLITNGAYFLISGHGLPFLIAAVATALFVAGVLLAWLRHGREAISLGTLLAAPFYAIAKLPLYAGFVRRRETEWVRSKRDDR